MPPNRVCPSRPSMRPPSPSACPWGPSSSPMSSASMSPHTWARSSPPTSDVRPRTSRACASSSGWASSAARAALAFICGRDGKPVKPAASAEPPPPDLIDRLILVLVNECAACLRERIVDDADFIDAAVIFGTGFAPFRGGPLAYARSRGVAAVVERLEELAARYGARFQPDSGWALVSGAAASPKP